LVETVEAPAPVTEAGAVEAVVGEEGSLLPRPVAVEAEGVETRVPGELAAVVKESTAPEMMTRAASPEIREAEVTGASLSQGAAGDEARNLDLACASWAVTSELDADSKDDEEVAAHHTLERGMTWARRAFDELILPATSVSFLVKDYLLDFTVFSGYASYLVLVSCRALSLQVRDVLMRCANSAWSGLSWRCSSSWPRWRRLVSWRAIFPRERPLKLPASRCMRTRSVPVVDG
jgi:hypothetical protein